MTVGIRSNGYVAIPKNPANTVGKKERSIRFKKTITAAAAVDGDLYILSGPHTFDDKVNAIVGSTPALTSAIDNDLGFFKKEEDGSFTALDADILWDGVTLATALSYRELLGTLNTSLDLTKNIGSLLGLGSDQEPVGGVYVGLTINTKSTAVSVDLPLEVKVEEATTK